MIAELRSVERVESVLKRMFKKPVCWQEHQESSESLILWKLIHVIQGTNWEKSAFYLFITKIVLMYWWVCVRKFHPRNTNECLNKSKINFVATISLLITRILSSASWNSNHFSNGICLSLMVLILWYLDRPGVYKFLFSLLILKD